jgi:hypothetical protein
MDLRHPFFWAVWWSVEGQRQSIFDENAGSHVRASVSKEMEPSFLRMAHIDGTHVRASISKEMETSFRGRKSHTTQNVMAAVYFDLWFTYVMAGREGMTNDALVLRDALERQNGLCVPQGNRSYL